MLVSSSWIEWSSNNSKLIHYIQNEEISSYDVNKAFWLIYSFETMKHFKNILPSFIRFKLLYWNAFRGVFTSFVKADFLFRWFKQLNITSINLVLAKNKVITFLSLNLYLTYKIVNHYIIRYLYSINSE